VDFVVVPDGSVTTVVVVVLVPEAMLVDGEVMLAGGVTEGVETEDPTEFCGSTGWVTLLVR